MNRPELQQLKIAWLAAREAGDTQTQLDLLRDHPAEQAELVDFIAAYHASGGDIWEVPDTALLPITQSALHTVLDRVFDEQLVLANLTELRKHRQLSRVAAAKGLRLSLDVWSKFESGAIELASLSQRHLERLAFFFQISVDQFASLLTNSQPALSMNRRATQDAARSEQQGPQQQTLAEAIKRSTMSKEDQRFWLESESI